MLLNGTSKADCPKCHENMVNIKDYHQLKDNSCPFCGEKKLRVTGDFLWDDMGLKGA